MAILIPLKNIPFQGGSDLAHEIALLESGAFSNVQNVRPTRPGFVQRKGCVKQHTTAADSQEITNGYQFCKGEVVERHLYAQRADGSLQEATSNPPMVTTGNFGTERLAAVSGSSPASFGNINDMMIYADGVRQAQINPGDTQKVYGCHVYKGTAAIPDIPIIGEDYTAEAIDGLSTTYVDMSALNTAANFHRIYIRAPVRANKINITMSANVNTNTATLSMKYRKNDGTFASVTIADGTAAAGKTLAQSGSITWTMPTDEVPHFCFNGSGFVYVLEVSAQLSSNVKATAVTFGGTFQDIINLWDGNMPDVVEARVYDSSQTKYSTYAGISVDLSAMEAADKLYLLTAQPVIGFFADPGMTPNKAAGTLTGTDIAFIDGGTGDDYITRTSADFFTQGFEAGMSVTIAGAGQAGNNATRTAKKVTATAIYFQTGSLTAEAAGASVTVSRSNATVINSVKVHTGSDFTALSNIKDGSAGMSTAGFITFSRNENAKKINFQGSGVEAYVYEITFDKKLSAEILVAFQYLPFFNINKTHFPIVQSVHVWKNRACYAFKGIGNILYFSARNQPMVLNGSDGVGRVYIGYGNKNDILCMRKFYNELIVWQAEKGEEGGSFTIVEGDSPTGQRAFDRLGTSPRYGIVNSKSAVVLESVNIETMNKERPIATGAFWISRDGVIKGIGMNFEIISGKIANYFDPTKAECIRRGYEDKHWLAFDRAYGVIRMGLCSGASATMANKFFIYDPTTNEWTVDVLTQPLSCMFEVEAETGNLIVLQMGGGQDGYVRQLNTTLDDESTAVHAKARVEINANGHRIRINKDTLRCKVQAAGKIVRTIMADGNPTVRDTKDLTMTAKNANDVYRRHYKKNKVDGDHISIEWSHNELGKSCHFLDFGVEVESIDSTADTSDT